MRGFFLASAVAVAAGGCAPPIPKPGQPSGDMQGALVFGLTIRGRDFPARVPHRIEEAYFAPVGWDGELDFDQPIRSNFRAGDYVVLLNIPPGRYAPVAGAYYHRNVRYLLRLDPALSRGWITEVRPGEIAFVGDGLIRTEWEGVLRAMGNFFKNVGSFVVPFLYITIHVEASSPTLNKSAEEEAAAMHETRRKLAATLWREVVDKRLAALGNPPEPIRKGKLFKTTVMPTPAGRFAYIDTLGWGAPVKVLGGLEWREPKGRALIQVSLMQPGMRGYKPREAYLQDMRLAGSAQDSHAIFEVALASRTAYGARYSTYQYPQSALTGSEVKVYVTETLLIPDQDEDYYLLRLRAPREHFDRFVPPFKRFLQYLVFVPREKPS